MMNKLTLLAIDFGTAPTVQNSVPNTFFSDKIGLVLNLLWIFFIAFAVIMFIVAGFHFLSAQGEAEKAGKARMAVLWGSIGVAIAALAFTLPFIVRSVLNL